MFKILTAAIFLWLLVKAIGLTLRITWGMAKVAACILIAMAFPALIVCVVFLGGVALLVPLALIGGAFGILKSCT